MRRKMLRYVLRLHRQGAEEWVAYLQRSARILESLAEKFDSVDWVQTYWRRKWRFAGRLATLDDDRWSKLVLEWKPTLGFGRSRGRPCTRWSDQIESFVGGGWQSIAADHSEWESLEDHFVPFLAYCEFQH